MTFRQVSVENLSPNARTEMARRGGGILATSFLSDSSQDSTCSRERSPKSPSDGGEDRSLVGRQHPRLSSRPPVENAEAIKSAQQEVKQARSSAQESKAQRMTAANTSAKMSTLALRHPVGRAATNGHVANGTTEAYFIGTPPDSGRVQGQVLANSDYLHRPPVPEIEEPTGVSPSSCSRKRTSIASRGKTSAVPSLDFGIQHWPASPRDSIIRPRQSARGTDVLLCGQQKVSAEQLGRGAVSRCSGSSLSAREQQPVFLCSSSGKYEAASSNSARPKSRKGLLGSRGATIADLKATIAALSATDCNSVGATNNPRAKSAERSTSRRSATARSELASGRNARRSCSPHSRSPSASSSRLSQRTSVDVEASSTRQKVMASCRSSGHSMGWQASCTHFVSSAHNGCSSRASPSEHEPRQKSAPSASRGNSSMHSNSRSSLRVDSNTVRDGQSRGTNMREQHLGSRLTASSTSLQAEGEFQSSHSRGSGTRSVPTPVGPSPWGAFAPSARKPSPTTPERGRPENHGLATGTSLGQQAISTKPSPMTPQRERPSASGSYGGCPRSSPGGSRSSRKAKPSTSSIRASLTQRCPSLTRRLGMT